MIALARDHSIIPFPQKQKSNEWFTPQRYVDAVREVMGGCIDLDPASCALANKTVKATKYYTKEDDGLSKEWKGRVFLNPPFGRVHPELKGSTKSFQVYFMRALLQKYLAQEIEQAVALVFGTSCCMPWFQPFWQFPICLVGSRIEFDKPDGTKDHFGYGNLFIYLGPNEQKFVEIFQQFGTIAKRVSTPRRAHVQPSLWEASNE